MIKYRILKNNVETNSWTSDFADETYYEPCFGKPQRWMKESECSQEEMSNSLESRLVEPEIGEAYSEYLLPAEYEVVTEDLGNIPHFDSLRSQRNTLLSECDWTQLVDSPLSVEEKADWAAYRQLLRDLPENTQDPLNPIWPAKPT